MTRTFNPVMEARAFRIWAYANPRAWDVGYSDTAEACNMSRQLVVVVANYKGWLTRFRVESTSRFRGGDPHAAAYIAQDVVSGRIGVSL